MSDTARGELTAARRGDAARGGCAIDRVLGALARGDVADARRLHAHVDMSLGWDSNTNVALSASQFAVPAFGGLQFNVAPASRPRQSGFAALGGGVNYQGPATGGWDFVGSLGGRFTADFNAANFDPAQASGLARASPRPRVPTPIPPRFNSTTTGSAVSPSAAPAWPDRWRHALSALTQVTAFTQLARLSYPHQTIRDVDRYVLGAGVAHAFNDGAQLIYGSAYAAREDPLASGVPQLGHQAAGLRLGAGGGCRASSGSASCRRNRATTAGSSRFLPTGAATASSTSTWASTGCPRRSGG